MRLRLTICRHSLPDTPIIWDIDAQTGAPTISTLLEQVNEVIPIESEDWGLEDYAVEIKGSRGGLNYECLHFQPVEKVLHEDDEVIIRPLLTPDLRVRRISGRHQISTDGRHLVDGVAFGRPLLRKPVGRPQINIPPRKRRRITYDEEEDGSEVPLELEEKDQSTRSNKQVILHADFDDDDEDDDEDFEPGGDEEEESNSDEEIVSNHGQLVLHADFDDDDEEDDDDFDPGVDQSDSDSDEENREYPRPTEEKHHQNEVEHKNEDGEDDQDDADSYTIDPPEKNLVPNVLRDITDNEFREQILIINKAFPNLSANVCKLVFEGNGKDLNRTWQNLAGQFETAKSLKSVKRSFSRLQAGTSSSEDDEHAKKNIGNMSKAAVVPVDKSSTDTTTNDALSGLTFFIAGELPVKSRDEAVAYVKNYGGEIVNSWSAKPSFVVLGSSVQPSVIKKMQKLELKIINEDGLTKLTYKEVAPAEKTSIPSPQSAIEDSDQDVEEHDELLLTYYDQNGLPKGSIASGTALKHMATVVGIVSPKKPRQRASRSMSNASNKSVRFTFDTPAQFANTRSPLDQGEESTSEVSSDTSSDEDGSEDSSSSSGSDSTDKASSDSSSEDDSDDKSSSDSDSSSDDDAQPEEVSSKGVDDSTSKKLPNIATKTNKPTQAVTRPGKISTRARNIRRRTSVALRRFKEKGVLPADTTAKEFNQLGELALDISPGDALSALETIRASTRSANLLEQSTKVKSQNAEFEARREQLLASISGGGVEVGGESNAKARVLPSAQVDIARTTPARMMVNPSDTVAMVGTEDVLTSTGDPVYQPTESIVSSVDDALESRVIPSASRSSGDTEADTAVAPSFGNATPGTEVSAHTALPTSSESHENTASRRRAKLDVGAGRRLLFGALGLKTPKTKKDEETLRSDLMKSVRLEKPKEPAPEPVLNSDEDENLDAWRTKINYRGVECCHEGIVLSEPPFPFVQRWDPQQQGFWSQRGKQNAKRKSPQEQDQYAEEEGGGSRKRKYKNKKKKKQNQESQEFADISYDPTPFEQQDNYLDASYVPSQLEDSVQDQYQESHQQPGHYREDIDGQISDQLMQDVSSLPTDEIYTSQGEEDDLPALPEDILSLADLKSTDVKSGMVVAFKQLIMSEATKWQPLMSEYRTAVVLQQCDNGDLELTLAKRDRAITEKQYDEDTGERIYSRFAMPDDEEDDEDDGNLTVSFSELVEPKIVQQPPTSLEPEEDPIVLAKLETSAEEAPAKSHEDVSEEHASHVPETQIKAPGETLKSQEEQDSQEAQEYQSQASQHLDSLEGEGEVTPKTPSHGKMLEIDLPEQPVNDEIMSSASRYEDAPDIPASVSEIPAEPPSDDTKRRIKDMIKEAGFRSSVPSSVLRDIRPNGMQSPGDVAVFEKLVKDMTEIEKGSSFSPKFNGFNSSPLIGMETEGSSPIRGSNKRGATTKSVPTEEEPSSVLNSSFGPMTSQMDIEEDSDTDPSYRNPPDHPSATSQASDHGRQPDFSLPIEDTTIPLDDSDYSILKKYDDAAGIDTGPELPARKAEATSTRRALSGSLAPMEEEAEHFMSDDSLPSLEQVFSQRASVKRETHTPGLSQVPARINEEYEAAIKELSDAGEDSDQSTPKPHKTSKKIPGIDKLQKQWAESRPKKTTLSGIFQDEQQEKKASFSQSQPVPKASTAKPRVALSQPVVKQSQSQKMVIPEGSQVWDLTLSSDVESESADDKASELNSDDAYFKKFKKNDSDDDDDYQLEPRRGSGFGRAKKTGEGRITRRHASENAQSSQRAKDPRRKTTGGRF
ncbi:hypothetical protein PVAG01_06743 [Phlyctema vagabunda]|uniref:BRCT domain-containing protein n=1 Tax=Phlyctema vagabunda TaxID=108571 RepID=A0ABR4PHL6_9HELO